MKKLLVWDGDNTLWSGKIIEGHVTVPHEHMHLCHELYKRGVIQAVASYNLQQDVDAVIHAHGLTDFFPISKAAFDSSKPTLIQAIMDELGLVKYSDVVFVDDEAFNRHEVSESLPGIITAAPEQLDEVCVRYFTKDEYTEEDRNRVRLYRSAIARKASGQAYGQNRIGFLRNCDMVMSIFQPTHLDKPRIDDLIIKANQMSAKSWQGGYNELWAIRASDKFGDYGLCGVLGLDDDVIKLLVISCRLQGMGYGSAFLGSIINRFIGRELIAEWVATEYNHGVRSLYEWYDFDIMFYNNDTCLLATKTVHDPVELPDWITIL